MGIFYDKELNLFHLKGKDTSYVMQIIRDGYLAHRYWGKLVNEFSEESITYMYRPFSPNPDKTDRKFSLDTLPQEYPQYGNSDFRMPAYQVQLQDGSTISDLRYHSHLIMKGKPQLQGLPATYVDEAEDAETLVITLEDKHIGLKVKLTYTVFHQLNVFTRSTLFINEGKKSFKLLRALSMSIDYSDCEFDLLHLYGAHAKERFLSRHPLKPGIQAIGSVRGTSSHQHNPFLALVRKEANELSGEVFAFHLVYSGNFLAAAEVDQFQTTRVTMGIHPFDFTWLLHPKETFQTPETVLVYSSEGLGAMSRTFHQLYLKYLMRGKYKDRIRPIVFNNWEATYFRFNSQRLWKLAKVASEIGIELFVLDDGWFGKRNNAKTSLGDWVVNMEKIPEGLDGFARKIGSLGLQFGLWVEPEMVSVDSELYRQHSDWVLHVPNRPRTESRNQLILDLSRRDVQDEIINQMTKLFNSAPISYVKWDMNRHMTEIGSACLPPERQRETAHRYMLGLYRVLSVLTNRFPDILFENCSGGGGRFDPGMLYYMPQTWTSDNTDAISRLKIQYGTSFVYPIISIGSHVSNVPNHQVGRITSLDIRGAVAMSGNLGYELDLTKLSKTEIDTIKEQIGKYKWIRRLIQFGEFYRLLSPFEGNEAAWLFVNQEKTEAIVFYFYILAEPAAPIKFLKLCGLSRRKQYQIVGSSKRYGGDELMNIGLAIPADVKGDFQSFTWYLREVT
ncbi:alpha-galactosidase [Bacillus kwashiorkori]|uniref:alpha-galactosidase n=1 Tax=Bacillus kwashiorkori TaxID=1522318 RepID=UPI000785D757|nr:alpha-galactosidase [Bacillus kwashiorkori]